MPEEFRKKVEQHLATLGPDERREHLLRELAGAPVGHAHTKVLFQLFSREHGLGALRALHDEMPDRALKMARNAGMDSTGISQGLAWGGFDHYDITEAMRDAEFKPDEIARALKETNYGSICIARAMKRHAFTHLQIADALLAAEYEPGTIRRAVHEAKVFEPGELRDIHHRLADEVRRRRRGR